MSEIMYSTMTGCNKYIYPIHFHIGTFAMHEKITTSEIWADT